ncbi:DUF3524 domain-containing protein [Planctomycetota bacterium]
MHILALEPYYGGSHKAFLDGWARRSKHTWTLLTLPAYKWKWRMRHSAIHFAQQAKELISEGEIWDIIFCSDILNLAEFLGLVGQSVQKLPSIVYFHENQLTYPVRFESERDYQFAMTNTTTALAATDVWLNSSFHRDSFLEALEKFLKQMPDFQPLDAVEKIRIKSSIYPPGIEDIKPSIKKDTGPIHILWAARWEHDKNPEDFFEALKILKNSNVDFSISVIGRQFRDSPEIFLWAKDYFAENIEHWGYQKTRTEYEQILQQADVIVSTARHEFFGLSVLEAISAGAYPLLPKRLSYPEILGLGETVKAESFFYDGTVKTLANELILLAKRKGKGNLWQELPDPAELTSRFKWKNITGPLDDAVSNSLVAG